MSAARVLEQTHADGVRPLLSPSGRVTVDGHPICAECGRAVVPSGPDRWRHVAEGEIPGPSPWLEPVRWERARELRTFADFTDAYPWTVRPELGAGAVTSEAQWREAMRRLADYHEGFATAQTWDELREGENPYLELVSVLLGPAGDWTDPGLAQVLDLPARRRELAALFSWAIPTDEAIRALTAFGPLLDCGAGTGYWAALAQAVGVDITACDATPPGEDVRTEFHDRGHRPWTDVQALSSRAAVRRYPERTLFLGWPPYDDDSASYAPLRAYRGDRLVFVGESGDGATGSVRFHREVALNWKPIAAWPLPTWPGLRDCIVVYERNPVPSRRIVRDRCDECHRFQPTGAIGRCDACFAAHPPALALRVGRHRVEYPEEVVEAMPPALRYAFSHSPNRIRLSAPTAPSSAPPGRRRP